MTMNEILALANAGFTKDEITKMMKLPEQEKQKPDTKTPPDTKTVSDMEKVLSGIDELTKAIQASNLLNTEQKKPESVEDIFSKIIGGEKNNG